MSLNFDTSQVTEKQEAINIHGISRNLVAGDTISLTINGKTKNFTVPQGESYTFKVVLTGGIDYVKEEVSP